MAATLLIRMLVPAAAGAGMPSSSIRGKRSVPNAKPINPPSKPMKNDEANSNATCHRSNSCGKPSVKESIRTFLHRAPDSAGRGVA